PYTTLFRSPREPGEECEHAGDRRIRAPQQNDRAEEDEEGSRDPKGGPGPGRGDAPGRRSNQNALAVRGQQLGLPQRMAADCGTRVPAVQRDDAHARAAAVLPGVPGRHDPRNAEIISAPSQPEPKFPGTLDRDAG